MRHRGGFDISDGPNDFESEYVFRLTTRGTRAPDLLHGRRGQRTVSSTCTGIDGTATVVTYTAPALPPRFHRAPGSRALPVFGVRYIPIARARIVPIVAHPISVRAPAAMQPFSRQHRITARLLIVAAIVMDAAASAYVHSANHRRQSSSSHQSESSYSRSSSSESALYVRHIYRGRVSDKGGSIVSFESKMYFGGSKKKRL